MSATVDYFFAPGSRYCYLAASQLPRIERKTGCRFAWKPLRGAELRALRGRDPFDGSVVSGQYDWEYRRRDAEAWAAHYGIPYREPPSHDGLDALARAAAAGELLGAAAAYGAALCRLAYGSDTWPLEREACLALAEPAGIARADVDRLLDTEEVTARLSQTAREAYDRGAFGVPTFFHAGRLFWGNDRLVLLERALREDTP